MYGEIRYYARGAGARDFVDMMQRMMRVMLAASGDTVEIHVPLPPNVGNEEEAEFVIRLMPAPKPPVQLGPEDVHGQ